MGRPGFVGPFVFFPSTVYESGLNSHAVSFSVLPLYRSIFIPPDSRGFSAVRFDQDFRDFALLGGLTLFRV